MLVSTETPFLIAQTLELPPKMTRDAQPIFRPAHHLWSTPGDVTVRSTMKAISSNGMLL